MSRHCRKETENFGNGIMYYFPVNNKVVLRQYVKLLMFNGHTQRTILRLSLTL